MPSKFRFLSKITVQTVFFLIAIFLLVVVSSTRLFTSKTYIITMAVSSNIVWFIAFAILPFIHVIQTGKFMEGVLRSWLFNIFGVFFVSVIIPSSLNAAQPELEELIWNSFPESIGVFPIIIMGWFPAFIICGIASGIYSYISRSKTLPE